jgi:WhiB family transcriptional regulator, redox-sensing transcriptional regulator
VNDWRDHARCRNEDPELFFPIGTKAGPDQEQIQAAKAVCARCRVRAECLAWALETATDGGIWGGKTEEERRALRRGRRLAGVRG